MRPMTLNADHPTPENAVRQYLDFLGDPATLIDHDRVAALQDALNGPDAPTDPIERVRPSAAAGAAGLLDHLRTVPRTMWGVAAHVQGRSGTWTYNDIESGTGASIGTVRKVVDDLVSAKKVKSLGADPDHASRGRAPNLFTVPSNA